MESIYDIFLDQQVVGKAYVKCSGLYYQLHCRCRLPGDDIYRVYLQSSGNVHCVGVCIPIGEYMEVATKIPISRLDNDKFYFYIAAKETKNSAFYPIYADQPFQQIDMLRAGRFSKKKDIGIEISEPKLNYSQYDP